MITTRSNVLVDVKSAQDYSGTISKNLVVSGKIRKLHQKFVNYCERQQEDHLGWTAITMAGQMFFLAPMTPLAIAYNGNRFALWIPVIVTSFAVALCNLMALPTKIVLPVFFTSVLISVGVIILSFIQ